MKSQDWLVFTSPTLIAHDPYSKGNLASAEAAVATIASSFHYDGGYMDNIPVLLTVHYRPTA